MVYHDPFRCGPNPCGWPCAPVPVELICEDYTSPPHFEPGLPKWDILDESGTWEVVDPGYLRIHNQSSIKLRLKFTPPVELGRNISLNMGYRAEPGGSMGFKRARQWSCANDTLTAGHWADFDHDFGIGVRRLTAGASAQEYFLDFYDQPNAVGVVHCVCDGWGPGYTPPIDNPYAYISTATSEDNYVVTDDAFGLRSGFEFTDNSFSGYTDIEYFILRPVLYPPDHPEVSICRGCAEAP